MEILQEYLTYLHEKKPGAYMRWVEKSGVGKNVHLGWTSTIYFGVAVIPSVVAAYRAASFAFSNAIRKCGGVLASRSPGFKACVSKEKIAALEKKMAITKNIKMQCAKGKNPEVCKQKAELEIRKCQNRIDIEKNKIQQALGEQLLAKVATGAKAIGGTAGGLGIMFVVGSIADKALRLALRTAQAVYSDAAHRCGVYAPDGPERKLCISKVKTASLNKQLGVMQKWLGTCDKRKNPEDCKEKVNNKILKIKRNIEIEQNNIKAYQNEITTAKAEEEFKRTYKQRNKSDLTK